MIISAKRIAGGSVVTRDGSLRLLVTGPSVTYWPPVELAGNGEAGANCGEEAWKTAATSKEDSRRANYLMNTASR